MGISGKLQKIPSFFKKVLKKHSDDNDPPIPTADTPIPTTDTPIPTTDPLSSNTQLVLFNPVKILTDDVESDPIALPDFSFADYSEAIVNMVKGSDPKFSIGIYGKWGSGKTTLMKLVENKLKGFVFSWNNIPGTDGNKLKEFLKLNFDVH